MKLLVWQFACQQIVEQNAAGIDVRFPVCLCKAELFRRSITCRAENSCILALFRFNKSADAVINDFYRSVVRDHDISGLNVTVNDPVNVQL